MAGRGDDEAVHVFLVQEFDEFTDVAGAGLRRDRNMGGDMKTGKLRRTNRFHGAAKRTRAPYGTIVNFFAPREFKRKKEPRIGAEFVDALAQIVAARVHESVTARSHDGVGKVTRFGMKQRLHAADPNDGRGNIANSLGAFRRRMPFELG